MRKEDFVTPLSDRFPFPNELRQTRASLKMTSAIAVPHEVNHTSME
jgi:hypothetical protein